VDRRSRRRQQTIDEALEHAVAIMAAEGVGALTVSEMARRMGVRAPSLYKYFPSLHAVYDELFARGAAANQDVVRAAVDGLPHGVARIRAGTVATVAWCVAHPALAQLLYWRPVPGFAPSAAAFRSSQDDMAEVRGEFAEAVRRGELDPAADSPEAVRLLTVVISGLISQQMANEPGADFATGAFTRLTDDALDMFLARYRPKRDHAGGDHADARP
jgi:AcrR family transcriptional regulator